MRPNDMLGAAAGQESPIKEPLEVHEQQNGTYDCPVKLMYVPKNQAKSTVNPMNLRKSR